MFVPPNWERRAPVSFATDGPILDVLQPRAEPPLSDPIGSPLHLCVEFQHPILDSCHSNEPGIHGVVEQWVTRSPAMGVIVGVGFLAIDALDAIEDLDDAFIACFDLTAVEVRMDSREEGSIHADRMLGRQSRFHAQVVVILTVHDGGMDHTRSVGGRDPIGTQDRPRCLGSRAIDGIWEERGIGARSDPIQEAFDHLNGVSKHLLHQRLREDELLTDLSTAGPGPGLRCLSDTNTNVGDLRPNGEAHIPR